LDAGFGRGLRLVFVIFVVDDEFHFMRSFEEVAQDAVDSAGQTFFQPVPGVGIWDANGQTVVFRRDELGAADPGVKGGFGHFHLKLSDSGLPGCLRIH
jgi:hypothetical protein